MYCEILRFSLFSNINYVEIYKAIQAQRCIIYHADPYRTHHPINAMLLGLSPAEILKGPTTDHVHALQFHRVLLFEDLNMVATQNLTF